VAAAILGIALLAGHVAINAIVQPESGLASSLLVLVAVLGGGLLGAALLSPSFPVTSTETEAATASGGGVDLSLIKIFASIIDSEDPFTAGRSFRVSQYAVRLARELGLSSAECMDLEYAALLHDIGRTAIRNDVFSKPGRLDDQERATMSTHPQTGYYILKDIDGLESAAELVRCHHEQPDGNGYPRGLSGEEIPLGSRIIMVAAAFDAMIAPTVPGSPLRRRCRRSGRTRTRCSTARWWRSSCISTNRAGSSTRSTAASWSSTRASTDAPWPSRSTSPARRESRGRRSPTRPAISRSSSPPALPLPRTTSEPPDHGRPAVGMTDSTPARYAAGSARAASSGSGLRVRFRGWTGSDRSAMIPAFGFET